MLHASVLVSHPVPIKDSGETEYGNPHFYLIKSASLCSALA